MAWNPSTNPIVAGVNIYYGGQSRVYTNEINAGTQTSLSISNLLKGSTYYFAATTYSAAGAESALSSEVSYTVPLPVNQPPTLNPIASLTINENAGTHSVSLSGIADGPGDQNQTLTVTAISSNPSLIHNPSVAYTSPNASGSIAFTPAANASGQATISVSVNDGAASNNIVTQTIIVTVNPVNQVPTLNPLNNLTINENAGARSVSLSGIADGPGDQNQTLTVTAISSNPSLIPNPSVAYISPNASGSIAFTSAANASGQATISVFVNDGATSNNIATQTFIVTVNPVNQAPTLNPLNNLPINENAGAQSVSLSGISAGLGNQNQTLTVTAISSNPSLIPNPSVAYTSPNASGSIAFTPAANASGQATISVSVHNGGASNNIVTQTFIVTVNPTDVTRPTLSITAPTLSQQWSNATFTATGKAGDNVAVTNVFYSLNGSAWTNATTANNWTNWSASLPLVPGTNSLKAFALDSSGNASTTNAVSFEYAVPMPLSVQVFGLGVPNPKWGSLSGGYTTTSAWLPGYGYYTTTVQLPGYTNGSLLAVNKNYTLTATPAPGFAFTNWSDGNGNLLTNGPTLSFTMAANLALVANFVDVTRPTLSITAPTLNQPWSNGTFTATGKANANVAVANVFYSLNGAPWTNATTLNNWTNWSASLPLVPGTNSLKAYALDASGNASTTNAVSFEYVVPMPLSVQVFGLGVPNPKWGSLSGGYTTTSIFIPGYGYYTTSAWLPGYTNGSLLAVNENYVITAIPASGFAFTNWSDGNGNLLTNGPTLRFTMAANLALVANFVDVTRPTLSIVSPTPNQQRSNGMFTATGKAGDNVAVANIFYSLNGAPWSAATTLDNWTNWSASLPPVPGTNTLQAFALDSSGNASTTNAVSFEYVVPMPLSVQVFGLGVPNPKWGSFNSSYTTTYVWIPGYGYYPTTVRLPGYTNGTLLAVNENYVITAVPSPGFVFTNWTDGSGNLLTNNATLQFTMATNLALVANFVDVQKPTVSILSPTPNQSSLWIGTGVQNQPDESIVSVAPGIMNATAPQGPQGVAGSAQNIPYEYWISTNATGNYFTNATHYSGGTLDNPFDGSTQQAFDLNMSKMPANSVIHLLPGIYQTLGSNPAGWGVKDNQRILGSGMNLTVLQHPAWEVTNHSLIDGYSVVGSQASPTNVDLENFTVDGNYYRSNYPAGDYASIDGITLFGSYNTVNNVRVINLAAYAPTNGYKEAWGITINPYHGSDHNLIENCEVSHFTATNSCNLSAITIWGSGVITGNTVIQEEPCDTTYGIEELSGSISGNITVGCSIFSYMDNGNNNINNLSVSNNSILYGQFGIVWMNVSESNVKISNNFFVMSNCTSLWAPYNFISCVVLTPHNSGGVTNFYNVQFSGNMVENVSSNALELSLFNAAGGIGLDISGNAIESCFSNILTGCAGVAISGNYELNGNYLAVTGTAGDNGAVAAVYYSLNGGLWTNASTANNWTNWTGSLALTPGTNTIQAYAEDTSGNLSLTNAVKYVYVVPRPLNVSINGKGSVTPNDNGVLLLVNENYTLTADAAAGFVFTNWTDGSGNLLTNNATLQFTMATNLALVANFVDVQKPTLSIATPTVNQQLTNGTFTVSGKAGDNVAVASVYYSLNGGPWTNATSANNWTNWTRSLTLTPDTNIIQAFAVDTSGNLSPTNTVEFVYVVPKPMVVYPAASARLAPASLVPTSFVNGQFALTVLGVTNYRCIVQASANLVDWIPVQTNTAPFTYVDTNAGKFKQHFYRTVYIQ